MDNSSNNKVFIIKLASILFAITFIATLLLTLCNYLTKDRIAELAAKNAEIAKQEVLEDATFENIELSDDIIAKLQKEFSFVAAYKAERNNEFAGYCINVAPAGFGGNIDMIVGLDSELNFTGIKIISMAETPGLGAKAQDESFYGQYADGKKGTLSVVKNNPSPAEDEIQAISGATITSKAVTDGANAALEIAKILKKEAE